MNKNETHLYKQIQKFSKLFFKEDLVRSLSEELADKITKLVKKLIDSIFFCSNKTSSKQTSIENTALLEYLFCQPILLINYELNLL